MIIFLYIFHQIPLLLKRNHNRSQDDWRFEIILAIIGIIYFSFQKLTTKVVYNFDNRNLEVSYVTLLKNDNKININFENIAFEFKNRQVSTIRDWTLYIYDGENLKHKIGELKDNFTKETLEKIAKESLD